MQIAFNDAFQETWVSVNMPSALSGREPWLYKGFAASPKGYWWILQTEAITLP